MSTDTQVAKPKINELAKYSLYTNAPGAEGRRSRVAWSIRDGNPRITVYTNIPSDKDNYGIISAPMNPETFYAFLDLLEKVALGENDTKYKVDCYTSLMDKDGKYTEKTLLSEVVFGKDNNGVIWLSVIAKSRPKIKFDFNISDFHKFYHSNGNVFTEAEASSLQTLAVIKALRAAYLQYTSGFKQPNPNGAGFVNKQQTTTSAGSSATESKFTSTDFEDIGF